MRKTTTTKKTPVKPPTSAACPKCSKEYQTREIGLECGNKGTCTGVVK